MHTGSCLCGAVHFSVSGELKAPDACHCRACRKSSGHYFVSTDVPKSALTITGADALCWYASSAKVRRGFCRHCGCSLFFDPPGRDWIGIAMGAFDGPTGTHTELHVFVSEKGDYYEICDGLPQFATVPGTD
ncbi:MAG: GFA family protein [Rhodanobacteraceae bacterium]|jgi:hypothetical protein|nr:GFA family protein [Rhodanobacteraceae bacterium]